MDIVNKILPKQKNPTGRAPKYSVEYYMMMAKQVVEDCLTYRDAAKIYGCSHGTVKNLDLLTEVRKTTRCKYWGKIILSKLSERNKNQWP